MSGRTEALIYILQTLGQLYLMVALLRFIAQLVRADFYNPLCQFTVKATQPLLAPLRRILPSVAGIDLAGLVLVLLLQFVLIAVVLSLAGVSVVQILPNVLAWTFISVASLFLKIFFYALIISVILSWVAPGSSNPGAQLTYQICEPLLAQIRKLLPDLGGIDISPIFDFIAINLIERVVLGSLAVSTGLVGPIRAIVSPFL